MVLRATAGAFRPAKLCSAAWALCVWLPPTSVPADADLSNHETLYAEDVPPNVAYQHVQLVAKVFPLAEQVKQVIDIAERFWEQHPDEYIAIHCAYGELSGWLNNVSCTQSRQGYRGICLR